MKLEKISTFRKSLRRLEREFALGLKDNPRTGGLSLVQCHTIINLGIVGETTIGEMAKFMCVDKSTLSRTVDGLVNLAMLHRFPHPTDRRYTLIKLSDAGLITCEKLNEANNDYFKRVFSEIPAEHHDDVMTYFDMFVNALVKYSNG